MKKRRSRGSARALGHLVAGLAAFAALALARAAGAAPLAVPDTALVDEHGRSVRFASDVMGDRVVAVQLVFTSCTTVCPPLGAAFGKLRALLGDRAGKEVELISISVDPRNDTPERLLAWAQKLGYGKGWTLLTGEPQAVATVLRSLGMATPEAAAHSPVVWIGHRGSGRFTRTHGLAPPATLLAAVDEIASEVDADRARRGEAIYRRGVTASGHAVAARMAAELPAAAVACANCHGSDRRGRAEGGATAADLSWDLLSDPDGRRAPGGATLPPYTPALLARAVADGLDSAGRPLGAGMPRYRLSPDELADLVEYLRTAH